jgi:hypothetical protein
MSPFVASVVMWSVLLTMAGGSAPGDPPRKALRLDTPAGVELRWLRIGLRDAGDPNSWNFQPVNAADPNAGLALRLGDAIGGPFLARLQLAYDQPDPTDKNPRFFRGQYDVLMGPNLGAAPGAVNGLLHASTPQVLLSGFSGWQLVSGELPGGSSEVTKTGALGITAGVWVMRVSTIFAGGQMVVVHDVFNLNAPATSEMDGDNREILVHVRGHSTPRVLGPRQHLRAKSTGEVELVTNLPAPDSDDGKFLRGVVELAVGAGITLRFSYP